MIRLDRRTLVTSALALAGTGLGGTARAQTENAQADAALDAAIARPARRPRSPPGSSLARA